MDDSTKKILLWGGGALVVGAILFAKRDTILNGLKTIVAEVWSRGVKSTAQLVEVQPGMFLRPDAAAKFLKMAEAAAAAGFQLALNTAWRSMEYQTSLYTQNPDNAARPGYSNHQGGTAIDIAGTANGSSALFHWLKANAASFGFFNYPPEPWHWSLDGH